MLREACFLGGGRRPASARLEALMSTPPWAVLSSQVMVVTNSRGVGMCKFYAHSPPNTTRTGVSCCKNVAVQDGEDHPHW